MAYFLIDSTADINIVLCCTTDLGSASASEISSVQAAIDKVDEETRQVKDMLNACTDREEKKYLIKREQLLLG